MSAKSLIVKKAADLLFLSVSCINTHISKPVATFPMQQQSGGNAFGLGHALKVRRS
jgi:hypothetical protein